MIFALIDNGSLEPAAHRNLRRVAATLSERVGVTVQAVSWKHSDHIDASRLDGERASTLRTFVEAQIARGEREFVFVPFFVSAQGAIGSALRQDLTQLQATLGGFEVEFTDGLAARGVLPAIVASRVRETVAELRLDRPAVVLVDHGGPSAESARVRDAIAEETTRLLGNEVRATTAASMEGEHGPLLADQLSAPGFDRGNVILAPLFLAPGRHAGPDGDLAQIARAAELLHGRGSAAAALEPLRCRFTGLIGTHPLTLEALTQALRTTLSTLHAQPFA